MNITSISRRTFLASAATATAAFAIVPRRCAQAVLFLLLCASGPAAQDWTDFTSAFYAVGLDRSAPAFSRLAVDSLGHGDVSRSLVIPPAPSNGPLALERVKENRFRYVINGTTKNPAPAWEIDLSKTSMTLRSRYVEGTPPPPWILAIDQRKHFATLLGLLSQGGSMQLPTILHLPGQGTFRISSVPKNTAGLGYEAAEVIKITFPPATRERPLVEYRWDVIDIHPDVAGIGGDARFDAFRRDWLNIFQISPRWRKLANNASSDTCAFCYYEYADVARRTPPLAGGLTALDMVRQTLESIMRGAEAYGVPGRPNNHPEFSADALPSLLIADDDYVEGTRDRAWLKANYAQLKWWTDKMLATDRDGNGLIEYELSGDSGSWPEQIKWRPANWWDTIGFGHQDAYANALAYRALRGMEVMAEQAGRTADKLRYADAADKLRGAYWDAFYNPATGVLAGWRSADGQLHDYYFLWVNGIAIHYGLVPKDKANSIMDHLLSKMKEVGYTRFDLGLPGNLIPVARKDYVHLDPRYGGGRKEDNSDGFQIYENGGATGDFAYFTLAALYDLGRMEEADRILFPMLDAFAKGEFQGFGSNGYSNDWRAWDGTPWGGEGFLVDNYYTFLAVLDREAAIKRGHGKALHWR
jgi:hypothetical protein